MKRSIIPIFVPHQGCPNDCVFCNQHTITGQGNLMTGTIVAQMIEEYRKTIPESRYVEVAFYGGSFTGIDIELQKELLRPACMAKEKGLIDNIRLSTRPDYIDPEILTMLKEHGVGTIELGVQSLDEKVLAASKRGHTVLDVEKAVFLIKKSDFQLGLQLMLGLPKEDEASFLNSVDKLIELKPDFMRLYPVIVLKNTELALMQESGVYQALDLEIAIERTLKAWLRLKKADIPIIRLGLQAADGLNEETIVAGPYHPAFRELVENEYFKKAIRERLLAGGYFERRDILVIKVNPAFISKVSGQKRKNILAWQDEFGFSSIKIKADGSIVPWDFDLV